MGGPSRKRQQPKAASDGGAVNLVEKQARLLSTIADQSRFLEAESRELRAKVRLARSWGCTWRSIGESLGVTAQAAQQRYGR